MTTASPAAAVSTAADPTEPPPSPATEDPHEDECVLCCYPFPFEPSESIYHTCCGELICNGCITAQKRTLIIGSNVKKPIGGSKEEESEFKKILSSKQIMVCPFCRTEQPTNAKEELKRLWERIDEYKDPKAMRMLGSYYMNGDHGLTKIPKKAEELYQQAYDLGDDIAAYNLSLQASDEARRMKYLEEGVKRGNAHCNNCLGFLAAKSDNYEEAKRQFMSAARSGHKKAMSNLMLIYQTPGSVVSKEDLATTLRTHKAANDTRKSEPREYAIRFKAFKEKMITTGKMKVVGDKDKRK